MLYLLSMKKMTKNLQKCFTVANNFSSKAVQSPLRVGRALMDSCAPRGVFGNEMSSLLTTEKKVTKDALGDKWVGNFELLKRIPLYHTDVTITKWRSKETGLKVVHVDYEGPIIKGYFAVATESEHFARPLILGN